MTAIATQQNASAARSTDWKRAAARMRAELERADLNDRARAVAAWAIRPTLLRGRSRVVIPNRAAVCGVLGISTKHMAEVIKELAEAGVLTLREVHEGWELLVYPDAAMWSVRMKWERGQMDALLRTIDDAPGQVQGELLDPEPCLDRARSEVAAENAARVPNLGTSAPVTVNSKANPFTKQLTSEQFTVHAQTALNESGLTLTREAEAEAMDQLRQLVGNADVEQWGGDWRKNWLRRYPRAFPAALATLLEESKAGWQAKKSPGAALKDLTRRYAQAQA